MCNMLNDLELLGLKVIYSSRNRIKIAIFYRFL